MCNCRAICLSPENALICALLNTESRVILITPGRIHNWDIERPRERVTRSTAAMEIPFVDPDYSPRRPASAPGLDSKDKIWDPTRDLAARFARDGFASIPTLTTAKDITRLRTLLDPLFARFDTLGERAVDLAGTRLPGVAPKSPEVNEAVILEPRLRETETYTTCRDIARHLLGVPVGYQFDHAIFKPPHNQTPTAWHQDEAYNREPIPLRSIHFWIPLQPATVENGCMQFVPGSQLGPRFEHAVVGRRAVGGTLGAQNIDVSHAVACPLPVGGATIHHPLTLHYTGANQSDHHRRAWILHFGAYGKIRRHLHPKVISAKLFGLIGV
jgi:Phytanoyl-CoA dioxygenase (PhyH)